MPQRCGLLTGGIDISATSHLPSNHSSHSRFFRLISEIDGDRPLSQDIVQYTLEAARGNLLYHTFVATLTYDWIETPSSEGQIGICYNTAG